MIGITVQHNFETAHRLPFLGGKCTNWHGHSWIVECMIGNEAHERPDSAQGVDKDGISYDYGAIKKVVRNWVDTHLDHGIMIGAEDKMLAAFEKDGCKMFVFGQGGDYEAFPWPTVEAVAYMLGQRIQWLVSGLEPTLHVLSVRVRETATNTAVWSV